MAIYHFSVKIIGRGSGRSSVAAAAYRAGEKLTNEYDGITHDYTRRNVIASAAYRSGEALTHEQNVTHDFSNKKGVVYSEIMLPENAPREFLDREYFWNTVEKSETRKDAQTAREVEISLPVEFTARENIELIKDYISKNFIDRGMCADFSIHDKGDGNPHAHIMLTTRNVNENGFGKKNRDWNGRGQLENWREKWADIANSRFKEKGFNARIDHRTLEAQGIDREPIKYMGLNYKYIKAQERAELKQFYSEIKINAAEIRQIERQIKQLEHNKEIELELLKIQQKGEEIKKNTQEQRKSENQPKARNNVKPQQQQQTQSQSPPRERMIEALKSADTRSKAERYERVARPERERVERNTERPERETYQRKDRGNNQNKDKGFSRDR